MSQATHSGRSESRASRLIQVGFVAVLLASWHFATELELVNALVLPKLTEVLSELYGLFRSGEFLTPLLTTMSEIAAALLISSFFGLLIGYYCSRNGYVIRVFDPLFSSLYAIPSILFYPLLILFFGIGVPSKIAMGVLIAIFPIILATIAGFSSVDRVYKTAARSMGADDRQMFFDVLLPAALPIIASGLRIGTITATGGTLAAEALGAFDGLGSQIVNMAESFRIARMYAFVLIAIALALAITFTAFAFEQRANRHAG